MKTALASLIFGALIGAVGTYYLSPVKEKTVTKEVAIDRVVKDIVTVVKTVERKDGTKETVTTTTDKSKESSKYVVQASKVTLAPQWLVSAGVDSLGSDRQKLVYNISASKRIIGPLYFGVRGTTEGTVGALITMEF